ncbi:MAG: CARDB domain-containing protein [Gammaproteobacteria bacterium]
MNAQDFAIEHGPVEYVIPVFTGWKVNYPCDDENVKETGIWVDEWAFDRDPTAPTGALRYRLSPILRDKDGDSGHLRSHKLTILGFRPTTVSVTGKHKVPDLVPFSPSGRYRSAFCRLEQGRKLRVTVKNQGNDNAAASTTTVTFGDTPFSLDTPAIPMGGSVDLLFDVPADCLSPYCSFKIMVDADSQVDELSMEGNNKVSGACLG